MRDGYLALFEGREFEASPDGDAVRLYLPNPEAGFDEARPGRYVRVVPLSEVAGVSYVRTCCLWRGQPFIILAEQDGWLRLEYTGGRAPVAQQLRLEEFDYGVYQGWAPKSEVTDIREVRA